MNKKLFIFEGIDHSGKSSLCNALCTDLQHIYSPKIPITIFSSPGKETLGSLGAIVYAIHHNNFNQICEEMNPISIQMLHIAAHLNNLKNRILPFVTTGGIVLLDRFWWSTLAYGVGDGIPINLLLNILSPEIDVFKDIEDIIQVFYIVRSDITNDYTQIKTNQILAQYNNLISKTNLDVVTVQNNHSFEKVKNEILQKIIENCK